MQGNDKGNGEVKRRSRPFPIVAIGASAGGLNAVKELLTHLSPTTGMAYVLIQHLSPDHKSKLNEILQRETAMPVVEVKNLLHIEANHFYIIPPNQDLSIIDGAFKLSPRPPRPTQHLPIDRFFQSLAEHQKEGSIGIVLSGTASDGTIGLRAIKAAGGLTFAQDDSAQFSSMPKSAIAEGVVDAELSPQQMAEELSRLSARTDLLTAPLADDGDDGEQSEDAVDKANAIAVADLHEVLKVLLTATGVDFTHYKKNTLHRRTIRRMVLLKQDNLKDYVELLKNNKQEAQLLYNDLLINVTHFFRDEDACEYLCKEILPKVCKEKSTTNPLRIWIPACSTGEEAFSLAMLVVEELGDRVATTTVQLFATDLSIRAINKARVGIYSMSEVANVSPKRLQRFFTRVDGSYRIVKSIREITVFSPHNLIKDPPFSRLDLISCCNLLIYLDASLQKRVLANFHYALNSKGYLILGQSETVGSSANLFTQLDKRSKIYLKRTDVTNNPVFDVSGNSFGTILREGPSDKRKQVKESATNMNLEKVVDNLLLTQYAPAGVVVTHDLEIIQFRGSTGLFLEPSPGKASFNLLKMARSPLGIELRAATQKVIQSGHAEKKTNIEITYKNFVHHVGFEITPLDSVTGQKLLFIIFEEVKTDALPDQKASHSKDRRVKQLEAELIALKEDIRAIVEDQEAANEELQSANEEIVSSNEELQSINEELETSKEELESSNEELMTINQELQIRNEQLSESHTYTESVIATIREAVIILDAHFTVKSANAAFYSMFKLRNDEVEGRIIYELNNHDWNNAQLKNLLETLLPQNPQVTGFELTQSFKSVGYKNLLVNARKVEQRLHGQPVILLAIEDITEHTQAKKMLEEREAWLRNMTNNVPVMIWVAGADKKYAFVNDTWLAFTGRKLEDEIGIGWTEVVHLDDLPLCLSTYHNSFETRKPYKIEYRMKRHDGEYRYVLNTAVPTFDSGGAFTGFTGSCVEIHDKRLLNEELEKLVNERTHDLQDANNSLERSNNELQQFAYVASHDLQEPLRKIITFSNRLKEKEVETLTQTGSEYINKIFNSADRMRHLIDDLLSFSQISRFEKKFVETDLNKVLQEVLSDFDLLIQEKNADLQLGKLPIIDAIPLQMSQLFHNLFSNALKFTSGAERVKIEITCRMLNGEERKKFERLEAGEDYYEIEFKDNGIGFPQEFADQIFIIFQRLNEKERYPGTGIGLALCRKIVRNHSGEIYAESKEGDGASFHIILPIRQSRER